MTNRIGPRMEEVVALVEADPGTLKLPVAAQVGPHGSLHFGYRTIKRTLEAGLIRLGGCVEAGCAGAHAGHRHLMPRDGVTA